MKKAFLVTVSLAITLLTYGITIESTAGGLSSAIKNNGTDINRVTSLAITGSINELDFHTMRKDMPALTEIDLSEVEVYQDAYPSLEIPESAFKNNTTITTVTLPATISYIGQSAFSGCTKLSAIVIPESISRIEDFAFEGCSNLKSIRINNPYPISLWNTTSVFLNVNKSTCTLSVPEGSRRDYQEEKKWGDFINIDDGTPKSQTNSTKKIKIAVKEGQAIIRGFSLNETITIYDIYGTIFYNRKGSEPIIINFYDHGIYILETDNQVIKFLIKD